MISNLPTIKSHLLCFATTFDLDDASNYFKCYDTCRSNLPVTIYRKNDLLGIVFPTLDFKLLASLSDPNNTAVLSWVTDRRVSLQVRAVLIYACNYLMRIN